MPVFKSSFTWQCTCWRSNYDVDYDYDYDYYDCHDL